MTKSELIERLAAQQTHIPAKAVEDAVKEMLEHMATTLAQGERIEIRGSAASLCITVRRALVAIRKPAIKWNWKVNTFRILNRVKSCAIGRTFTVKQKTTNRKRHAGVVFACHSENARCLAGKLLSR